MSDILPRTENQEDAVLYTNAPKAAKANETFLFFQSTVCNVSSILQP